MEGKLGETTFGAFRWLTSTHTLNRRQYLTHHPKRDVVRWQRADQVAKINSVDELRETENHPNEKAQAGTLHQGTPGLAKIIGQPWYRQVQRSGGHARKENLCTIIGRQIGRNPISQDLFASVCVHPNRDDSHAPERNRCTQAETTWSNCRDQIKIRTSETESHPKEKTQWKHTATKNARPYHNEQQCLSMSNCQGYIIFSQFFNKLKKAATQKPTIW